MTIAVDFGRKATKQTDKTKSTAVCFKAVNLLFFNCFVAPIVCLVSVLGLDFSRGA